MSAKPSKPVLGGREKVKVAIAQKSPAFMNRGRVRGLGLRRVDGVTTACHWHSLIDEGDLQEAITNLHTDLLHHEVGPLWTAYPQRPSRLAGRTL